eukprot:scaffold16654_cov44-Prasinocladus_malaysianus.AAC.1
MESRSEISQHDADSGAWNSDSITGYAANAWARMLFYPSLAYNIARSTIQPEYRWYTEVVEGIKAVVTLNEEFELFVTAEHYRPALARFVTAIAECNYIIQELGIDHLHLPTVDFLYAPGVEDMLKAVTFMQSEHITKQTSTLKYVWLTTILNAK